MPILHRLLSYCLALALLVVAGVAHAEKTAVIDSQRAALDTEDGQRAQATLKKLFDARQLELDRKRNELQKEREALEAKRNTLSPDVLTKRTDEWLKRAAALQQDLSDYSKEMQRKQTELTQPILTKVFQLVAQLAKKEGYDLVVERSTVAYVREGLDLTARVIQLYNQGAAATATPPAPAKK